MIQVLDIAAAAGIGLCATMLVAYGMNFSMGAMGAVVGALIRLSGRLAGREWSSRAALQILASVEIAVWLAVVTALGWRLYLGADPLDLGRYLISPYFAAAIMFGAAVIGSTGASHLEPIRVQGQGALFQSLFVAVAFLVLSLVNFESRAAAIMWGSLAGIIVYSAGILYARVVMLPRIARSTELDRRDDRLVEELQRLGSIVQLTAYLPRFIATRRDIEYLQRLRSEAFQALRRGDLKAAASAYDAAEAEFPRVLNRIEADIGASLRAEIVDQLHNQARRATDLQARVEYPALKQMLGELREQAEQKATAVAADETALTIDTASASFGEVERLFSTIDSVEAVDEALRGHAETLARHNEATERARAWLMVAEKLGREVGGLRSSRDALIEELSAFQSGAIANVSMARQAVERIEQLSWSLRRELSAFEALIDGQFDECALTDGVTMYVPSNFRTSDERTCFILQDGLKRTAKQISVNIRSAILDIGQSTVVLPAPSAQERYGLNIVRMTGKRRGEGSLDLDVTNDGGAGAQNVMRVRVSPNLMEMVQASLAVSGVLGVVATIVLVLTGQDLRPAGIVGAVGATAFFLLQLVIIWYRRSKVIAARPA